MNLTEKLIYQRKKHGLTQSELAEKLNVSRQAVSRWEGGYAVPSTDKIKTLCEIYHVSVDYLLNGDSDNIEHNAPEPEREQKCETETEKENSESVGAVKKTVLHLVMASIVAILIIILISTCSTYLNTNEKTEFCIDDLSTDVTENSYGEDTFLLE